MRALTFFPRIISATTLRQYAQISTVYHTNKTDYDPENQNPLKTQTPSTHESNTDAQLDRRLKELERGIQTGLDNQFNAYKTEGHYTYIPRR